MAARKSGLTPDLSVETPLLVAVVEVDLERLLRFRLLRQAGTGMKESSVLSSATMRGTTGGFPEVGGSGDLRGLEGRLGGHVRRSASCFCILDDSISRIRCLGRCLTFATLSRGWSRSGGSGWFLLPAGSMFLTRRVRNMWNLGSGDGRSRRRLCIKRRRGHLGEVES